jgi:hypothetical protein
MSNFFKSQKLIFFIFLFLALPANSVVVSLDPGSSIQTAIDNASDGDIISLNAGVYKGNIDFKGKAITIRGVGKESIIRGDGTKAVVFFVNDEGFGSLLDKVQITGGIRGGAILIENASPRINRCWIVNNQSIGAGSAIYIFGNDSSVRSAAFFNNVIARNKTRSLFFGNEAHAIYIEGANPSFINNTIIQNDRSAFYITKDSDVRITNNIIAFNGYIKAPGNVKKRGLGIEFNDFSGSAQIDYNLFYKNRLGDINIDGENLGSISELTSALLLEKSVTADLIENKHGNPNFIKLNSLANLRLGENSSAIDIGDPDELFDDIVDNSRNDAGATGGLFIHPNLDVF